jgi:hypothetical protein
MGDMRISGNIFFDLAICDNTAVNFKYESNAPKNFFTDIVTNISATTFLKN